MEFRTTFPIIQSEFSIDYETPVMFIGSCFSAEMGKKMEEGRMQVLINPAGTVYNPASICNNLEAIIENRKFTITDLNKYGNLFISFSHYTNFSNEDKDIALDKINSSTQNAHLFLKNAKMLFITFGTSRVYRLRETGRIVSNCHKLPDSNFTGELLDVEEIIRLWGSLLEKLNNFNKDLKVIFTVSPVRHWKDGAHGNQVSKSILFLGIEQLLGNQEVACGYFPAYELMMDDLRDYRFYAKDMIHPSAEALDYIWEAFTETYFTPETKRIWREINDITLAINHRFVTDSRKGKKDFALGMLRRITDAEKKHPYICLDKEKSYFVNLLEDNQ
jgi:hypothetical protein